LNHKSKSNIGFRDWPQRIREISTKTSCSKQSKAKAMDVPIKGRSSNIPTVWQTRNDNKFPAGRGVFVATNLFLSLESFLRWVSFAVAVLAGRQAILEV
jgi:hypothetical protein